MDSKFQRKSKTPTWHCLYINPKCKLEVRYRISAVGASISMAGEKMRKGKFVVFFSLLALAASLCCIGFVDAATSLQPPVKLVWHYYKRHTTCNEAEVYIRHQVKLFWDKDKSITANFLRLLYSDCFVTVCY